MLRNPEAAEFFRPLSAHSDVASELAGALTKLGDYELNSAPREYGAQFAVTADTVFCGAAGMASTYWRLSAADREIAVATGARPAPIGPDWVEITLFRSNWPKPDLRHWALRAYGHARSAR
jgi:hypothetical protein